MKKCVVIYNPNSGKYSKEKLLSQFPVILKKYGFDCKIIKTEYKTHAIKIVKNLDDDVNLVISVGGDGTFNETMTGNFEREKRLLLSHLPVGTTNDIGTMYGYGKNIIQNLIMTLEGEVKDVDICLINNRPFVYTAGFGKFMNIPYETPRSIKKKIGYLAYLSEGIKDLKNKTNLYDITYEIDNEIFRGLFSLAIITNANRIAGINNFYKDIKLDDDRFEILFCNLTRKKDLLKSLYFLTLYDVSKVPGFYFYKTNNLKIKFNTPLKKSWCIDGEQLNSKDTEYNIEIEHNVKVLIPKKNIKNLFINK